MVGAVANFEPHCFRQALPAGLYDQFLVRFHQRLLAVIGERSPSCYPFKGILFWARR